MQAKSFVKKQYVNKKIKIFFDRGGGHKSLFLNSFLVVRSLSKKSLCFLKIG